MSSSSSESNESLDLRPEIKNEENIVIENLMPAKSYELYTKAYDNFVTWKIKNRAPTFTENIFLAYFQELAKTRQASTLWSIYSMLKCTVNTKNNVKIERYSKLLAYLKSLSKGHKAKKSKVFSSSQIETFLDEAPDNSFLAIKVALIFGIHGACRGNELLKITMDDIENPSDDLLLVKLTDTRTKMDRSFIIRGKYKQIVQKYENLRPTDINTDRFFIRFQNGKCFKQVIGKNKFSNMPQKIAQFLKLPDPKLYTGHCFRRTSATIKQHGGWIAEGYVESSIEDQANISKRIFESIKVSSNPDIPPLSPCPSTSKQCESPLQSEKIPYQPDSEVTITQTLNKSTTISVPNKTITINFQNCEKVSNVNINF